MILMESNDIQLNRGKKEGQKENGNTPPENLAAVSGKGPRPHPSKIRGSSLGGFTGVKRGASGWKC